VLFVVLVAKFTTSYIHTGGAQLLWNIVTNEFYVAFVTANRAGCPTMRSALQYAGFGCPL